MPLAERRLNLRSHGRTLTIGAFLTADEKHEVARALGDALARLKAGTAALAP